MMRNAAAHAARSSRHTQWAAFDSACLFGLHCLLLLLLPLAGFGVLLQAHCQAEALYRPHRRVSRHTHWRTRAPAVVLFWPLHAEHSVN